MSEISLSKEEAINCIENGELVETEELKEGVVESFVFEKDGKHYMFDNFKSFKNGRQFINKTPAYEVKLITKIVKEWVVV